ncbi:MAG: lamin tail domain-containing protein [Bacteroidota bacterium]
MRFFTLLALLSTSAILAAQTNHNISVGSNFFTPNAPTIAVGDTVTWTNTGGFHNVDGSMEENPGNPEGFENGPASSAAWTFSHVFTLAGTYDYHCDPHLAVGMTGQIIVEAAGGNDAVVISEIMYNPPEIGTDSLEFIELYNPGTTAVDLSDWTMSDGVELTFPAGTMIDAEGFLIICVNEAAFVNNYNYSGATLQWEEGALSNGGEEVAISNADGIVVDELTYDDNPPWPTGTDGQGASIQLCDAMADNSDPANWAAAVTPTGTTINEVMILANPGSLPACEAPSPQLQIGNDFTVDEDADTVRIRVLAVNFTEVPVFEVALDGASTATIDADFSVIGGLPQVFTGAGNMIDTFFVEVPIVDDMDEEDNETIILNFSSSQMDVQIPNSSITVTIDDNDATSMVTTIGAIDDIDADGVGLSVGETVTVEGVVHAPNFRPGGITTTIIDGNNDGIGLFNIDDDLGYTVTEGDLLRVTGEVTQFRGLLQIEVSAVEVLSSGNELFDPTLTSELGENEESQLVTLENLVPESTEDVPTSGTFNFTMLDAGDNPITLRIDEDVNIDFAGIIADYVANGGSSITVTGVGGQFDTSSPFDGGYQLFPRRDSDIATITSVSEAVWAPEVQIFPNPVQDLLEVNAPVQLSQVRLLDLAGRMLLRQTVEGQQVELDLSALPAATYYLQIISPEGQMGRMIMKQ